MGGYGYLFSSAQKFKMWFTLLMSEVYDVVKELDVPEHQEAGSQ